MTARSVLLFAGLLGSGLVAGLFFGWVVAVIPGLRRVDDDTYVATMQSINRAILNPAFLGTFMGTAVVLAAATVLHVTADETRRAWWIGAAAVTYVVGVFGVTAGGNVPLNDRLDAFDLAAADEATLADRRHGYETPWVRWNAIRTAASIAALGFASIAALTSAD